MKQRNSPSKNEIKILKIQENIAKNKEMSVELLYNFYGSEFGKIYL